MTENILCHIVGLNNTTKDNMIDNLLDKYKKLVVVDLDEISYKISNDVVMDKLFTKYNVYNKNGRQSEAKHIEKKMGKFWQIIMAKEIKKVLYNNPNKKFVFLGLTTFQKNLNYGLNIGCTVPKYFYKTNIKKNAQEIIKQNLEKYEKYIIEGTYPLKLIDLSYLMKKREEIIEYYTEKKDYQYKNLRLIINYIEKNMDQYESIAGIPRLYVGSLEKHDDVLDLDKVVAYTEDWLAIVSMIPNVNKKVKKGFMNNRPFIEEKCKNAMNCFNIKGYLYQVDKSNFRYHQRGGNFKLVAEKPVKILKRTYIANVYKKLSKKKIKFEFMI